MKMNQIYQAADELLAAIKKNHAEIASLADIITSRVEAVKAEMQPLVDAAKADLALHEAELEEYVTANRKAIATGTDIRVELKTGALIFAMKRRVKRIRKMLENLEKAGRKELIKIVKEANWDEIEKLTDAELKALGTKRIPKEVFSYEIK